LPFSRKDNRHFMKQHDYTSAGVNVVAGDEASTILYNAAKHTWGNRIGKLGDIQSQQAHFRSNRYFCIPESQDGLCFGVNFDGIGTKIEVAERLHSYRGLAKDLLAMVCDDASIQGAEPIVVGSILDMAKVDLNVVRELAEGIVEAAADAEVAVINGELAELPGRINGYGPSPFNWGAACLWAGRKEKLAGWEEPLVNDVVVGIEERGFRSNGFSLLRAIFRANFGDSWGTAESEPGADLIRFAARPSIIYTPLIHSLNGGLDRPPLQGIRALLHITGGGIVGRLRYYCKHNNVGARLHSLLAPPPEMRDIVDLGNVDIKEAYRTWNMGIGLIAICTTTVADKVIKVSREHGWNAAVIGSIESNLSVDITYFNGVTEIINPI
jgi:phosphoribosylformylglycinamidine cyclo-ligase